MNGQVAARVKSLRFDFESVTGNAFQHTFFCPIVFKDERAQLCRAHVINRKFRNSDPSWTIQRADVDAWVGTLFEDDFLALEYKDVRAVGDIADADVVPSFFWTEGLGRLIVPKPHLEDGTTYRARRPTKLDKIKNLHLTDTIATENSDTRGRSD